jgi:hypothetical protein
MNSFDHKVVDGFIQTMERNGAGLARFGEVKGYDGAPLSAPELPAVPLKPRGRVR